MKVKDPITDEWCYFIDKCLLFGASISCALFQRFSDALCFLIEVRAQVRNRITNYLDDYLFLARSLMRCNAMIQNFLSLYEEVRVPIAMEKTEWATEIIVFLGILLDGRHLVMAIPLEKKNLAVQMLTEMIQKRSATVKDLQCLCGLLNFIGRAVVPGRTFTRRMYSKYTGVVNLEGSHNVNEYKLRQHHHMRLDSEFKLDCKIWLEFLMTEELSSVVNRPMIDVLAPAITSTSIAFYSDASKKIGFGALLNNRWIHGDWDASFIKENDPSIAYLELFALTAGILTWESEPELTNCRISIFVITCQ